MSMLTDQEIQSLLTDQGRSLHQQASLEDRSTAVDAIAIATGEIRTGTDTGTEMTSERSHPPTGRHIGIEITSPLDDGTGIETAIATGIETAERIATVVTDTETKSVAIESRPRTTAIATAGDIRS